MKKSILILLVLCSFYSFSQNMDQKDIPSIVKSKFASLYPSVTDVKWGKINLDNYECEFNNNGVETAVLIDNKGLIFETDTELKPSELPASVNDYILKNYAWKKLRESEKSVDGRGKVTYRVGIGVKEIELVFDYQGNFVRLSK